MATTPRPPDRSAADPLLLAIAALVLLFLVLFLVLYVAPAGIGPLRPDWWVWPLLTTLFFAIVALEWWRRKRRDRARMSAALRTAHLPDEG